MNRPVAAQQIAIAIVEWNGRFLVGRRGPDVPLAGRYEFPGGKVHAGESPASAAQRECLEETGIAVVAVTTLEVVVHEYPHGKLELHFVNCRSISDATPLAPFRWVDRAELATLPFPEANRTVLARLLGREESQIAPNGEPA